MRRACDLLAAKNGPRPRGLNRAARSVDGPVDEAVCARRAETCPSSIALDIDLHERAGNGGGPPPALHPADDAQCRVRIARCRRRLQPAESASRHLTAEAVTCNVVAAAFSPPASSAVVKSRVPVPNRSGAAVA